MTEFPPTNPQGKAILASEQCRTKERDFMNASRALKNVYGSWLQNRETLPRDEEFTNACEVLHTACGAWLETHMTSQDEAISTDQECCEKEEFENAYSAWLGVFMTSSLDEAISTDQECRKKNKMLKNAYIAWQEARRNFRSCAKDVVKPEDLRELIGNII